jgi:hypothetical protein
MRLIKKMGVSTDCCCSVLGGWMNVLPASGGFQHLVQREMQVAMLE